MSGKRRSRPGARSARLGVVAAVLALVGGFISAGAAQADNAASPAANPPGYVATLPSTAWSNSGSYSLSSLLPGNLPGKVTASTTGVGGRKLSATTTSTSSGFFDPILLARTPDTDVRASTLPAAWQSCMVAGNAGDLRYCATDSVNLSFDHAVADPVIGIVSGTFSPDPATNNGSTGCFVSFSTVGIGAINGSAPVAGQTELLSRTPEGPGDWTSTWVDNQLVPAGHFDTIPGKCAFSGATSANPSGISVGVTLVQLHGVVATVRLDFPTYRSITKSEPSNYLSSQYQAMFPKVAVGFAIPAVDLGITKSGPATVTPTGDVTWSLAVRNNNAAGGPSSHGFVITDAVPSNVTDARVVDAPDGCSLSGNNLTCAFAPTGFQATVNSAASTVADLSPTAAPAIGSVLAPGATTTITLAGRAPATGSVTNTAMVAGFDVDAVTSNNTSTAITTLAAPSWNVAKNASVDGAQPAGGYVKPGDVISYTVTATSVTGAVAGTVITDDLSRVLSSAKFVSGSATLKVGEAAPIPIADPSGTRLTTPPFTLPAGETATLSYQVTVGQNSWSATLTNTATATSDFPLTACEPCSTTNKTGALVQIQKNGVDGTGVSVGLDGAAFQLRADDKGTPGAALTTAPVTAVPDQPGRFRAEGLLPGTYWLQETASPGGYQLLAEPVAFTVASDGALAVVDAHANPNVTAAAGVLTVADARALVLPMAGGHGAAPYLGAGGIAAALALTLAGVFRGRWRAAR